MLGMFIKYLAEHRKHFRIVYGIVIFILILVLLYANRFFTKQTLWDVQSKFDRCASEGEVIKNKARPLAPQKCCWGLQPGQFRGPFELKEKVFCYPK